MAASSDIFCGPCYVQHITKSAKHWCPECEEGLCSDCQRHHSSSKSSIKHAIIAIECFKKLPAFVSNISNTCKEHTMKFNMYCPYHDAICCPLCVTMDHGKCTDLKAISEFIKSAKTSALFSSIEERLQEIIAYLDIVVKNVDENKFTLKQQRKKILNEINQLRRKINAHLDSLEETMIKDFDKAEEKVNAHLDQVKLQMSFETMKSKELKYSLLTMKEYGTDIQAFYGGRKIILELEKKEKMLQSMSEDDSLKEKHIETKISDKISKLLSLKSFGSITSETGPLFGVLTPGKDILGQTLHSTFKSSQGAIADINLILQSTIDYPAEKFEVYVTSCCVCHNGKLILVNYYSELLAIVKSDGTLDKMIAMPSCPIDATSIDNNTTAVSTESSIIVIDIDTEVIKHDIKTAKPSWGITYNNMCLLWCEKSIGVRTIRLPNGKIKTLIAQSDLPRKSFLTVFKDKIYQSNSLTNTVSCYTIQGEIEWEFKVDLISTVSCSLTVDNNCNVYVLSLDESNIIGISSDGKQCRQLLNKTDYICRATGISFHREKRNLFVTNDEGITNVYHIT